LVLLFCIFRRKVIHEEYELATPDHISLKFICKSYDECSILNIIRIVSEADGKKLRRFMTKFIKERNKKIERKMRI
jgi:hypothetical protein